MTPQRSQNLGLLPKNLTKLLSGRVGKDCIYKHAHPLGVRPHSKGGGGVIQSLWSDTEHCRADRRAVIATNRSSTHLCICRIYCRDTRGRLDTEMC